MRFFIFLICIFWVRCVFYGIASVVNSITTELSRAKKAVARQASLPCLLCEHGAPCRANRRTTIDSAMRCDAANPFRNAWRRCFEVW